jgi:TPR repeat protein
MGYPPDNSTFYGPSASFSARHLHGLRAVFLLVALLALILATGCDDGDRGVVYMFEAVQGENPPAFDQSALTGGWRLDGTAVRFEHLGFNLYRLQSENPDETDGYDVQLVTVGAYLFFDLSEEVPSDVASAPLHFPCRMAVQENSFTLSCLNREWLDSQPEETIPRQKLGARTMLTGSPKDLHDLFVAYADDPRAFPLTWTFHRPNIQLIENHRKGAEAGNAESQQALARAYTTGEDIDKDPARAAYWMLHAAHQGLASAEYHIGKMYRDGDGLEQDRSEALTWYMKAAEQDYPDAFFDVGQMYWYGLGVKQSESEAVEYYQQAASRGFAPALYELGTLHENGGAVPRDEALAINYYGKAVGCDPSMARAWNELAWHYATAEDPAMRNPHEALGAARKAVELTDGKDANFLDTLAEAYYVNGQFRSAVETERRALKLASGNDDFNEHLQKYLLQAPEP